MAICVGKWNVPEDLLVVDMEANLPILSLNPEVHSYNEPIEESLFVSSMSSDQPRHIEHQMEAGTAPQYIHKRVYAKSQVPQAFVDKLIAFHLGHLSLSVSDLTDYFLHLDRTFSEFAYNVPAFRQLSPNDQSTLLLNNSPLYFQLHLAR